MNKFLTSFRRRALIAAAAFVVVLNLASCYLGRVEEYPSLSNQGILPLSSTNAYVGSNLFIANEAERSPYLYNFLKGRGGPMAIEIIEPKFGSARVLMFYPHEREVYAADIQQSKYKREWIIRGPYGIDRKDYRKLGTLESLNGEPLFFIRGKQEQFHVVAAPDTQPRQILQPVIPTPLPAKPTPKKKVQKKGVIVEKKASEPTEFRPLNSDQQAIQMSLGFAERASNGDVIHTVKSDTETLESIAQWYTGSTANAEQLAKANALGAKDPLAVGTRISVPTALVKNLKIMGTSK